MLLRVFQVYILYVTNESSLFSTDFRPMDVTEARSSQNIGHA